ncbi:glycosyltransferase family A protein [Devosia sp. LjRoot16]|uniref:glycosyltransferase family 2 protein n=1 Tax=Devosia sp. LjRoot16 TaxID=3342271 RepID=UPI003ECEE81D
MINQQAYIYDRSLRGTSSRVTPDRLIATTGSTTGPLVSCLMVTRGDVARVRASIGYFRRQTYRNKELIVVCGTTTAALQHLVEQSGADVRLVPADRQLSLGLLRNVSVDQARGEIVCVWDDDDIYGVHRLERGVGALLQARADAVFLRQLCLWSPHERLLRLSNTRVWEGSMIAFKNVLPRYPDAARGEDTALVEAMLQARSLALMDDPLSYCYCIHGQNTSGAPLFQGIFNDASLKFSYGRALAAFSALLAFDEHPAFGEPDRKLLAENAGDVGQLRRLETYVGVNQFLRRLRYRFKRRAA